MKFLTIIAIASVALVSVAFMVLLLVCFYGDIKQARQFKRFDTALAVYTHCFGAEATHRLIREGWRYKVPVGDLIDIMESAVLSEERRNIYEH